MKVILIRHAVAQDRERYSELHSEDSLRPLTEKGYRQMIKAARGLREIAPELAMVVSSPFTRALQTADVISSVYGTLPLIRKDSLAPGGRLEDTVTWLQSLPQDQTIVLVGHEPNLSALACQLLSGNGHIFLSLQKGSALMVDFHDELTVGGGLLSWMLLPKQLRSLRKGKQNE